MLGGALSVRDDAAPIRAEQVQPASLDLRLGRHAHRMRAGFLASGAPIESRIERLAVESFELDTEGCVLERGGVYLVELEERLDLAGDLRGRFNPRSSTGRCDVFTRVVCPGHPRFDETPPGYRGGLWL
ncbi:MAG: 2'-deoxycytidine 5'-triphosphate deaminase, partial [Planctomycetes bacterium]|nr:2'-deoxycytidine 5'-triphosphate deaminase [Planctomycetota bacterium]